MVLNKSSSDSDEGIRMNVLIQSKSCNYMVRKLPGEGTFGRVLKSVKLDTFETVAVKAAKQYDWVAWKEAAAVKEMSVLDLDQCNLVKYYEIFDYKCQTFISMEMLDISLHDFVNHRYCYPLLLHEIRVILKQMFVALTTLKSIGMMHADIKPDNIMLVNQSQQLFKVKGIPVNESADLWALGHVAAFLYLGKHLYPTRCEYEMMQIFVQVLSQPNDSILESGKHTKKYFWNSIFSIHRHFHQSKTDKFTCIEDLSNHHLRPNTESEVEDTLAFLSLLKITPVEGLGHRFITMKHLPEDPAVDCYVESSRMSMKVCPPLSPENEIGNFVTSSEIIKNRKQSSRESRLSSSSDNRAIAAEIQRNRQNRAAARNKDQLTFRRLAWHAEDNMSWGKKVNPLPADKSDQQRLGVKPGMTPPKNLVESSDSSMESTSTCTSRDSREGTVNRDPAKRRISLQKRVKNFFLRLFGFSSN
ncbi:dual specificity protein kinase YAK1 [Sarotherodon galilaeus]